ncbi:MAG: hypothetical protein RLZZ164_901 [Actinomycetota bacterium]
MSQIGNKAANLLRMKNDFGLDVPDFVVVPFDEIFDHFAASSASLAKLVNRWLRTGKSYESLQPALETALRNVAFNKDALTQLTGELNAKGFERVSFRTSAVAEDTDTASFAGQYQTFLDVALDAGSVRKYLLACFASLFAPTVLGYARAQGLTDYPIAGSVVIQEMFFGDASGVLFTEDGTGSISVDYVDGWRNSVVEGEGAKHLAFSRADAQTGFASNRAPAQLKTLAAQALTLERRIGQPLDIEFAYDRNRVVFLQYRPITVPKLDYYFEWDSTNISENYPGITLPLTYSFIRAMYAGVYPAFLRMLGASAKAAEREQHTFDNMVGYLNGHVYYRITNWYEAIKLMPGRSNQEAFEAMLNPVKKRGAATEKRRTDVRSAVTAIRFVWLLSQSEWLSRKFKTRVGELLDYFESYHLDHVNAAAIFAFIKRSRREVHDEWAITILNDIRLMVFHGLLKRLFFAESDLEYLTFLQGLSDRASIKPLEGLKALGLTVEQIMQDEKISSIAKLQKSLSWPKVAEAARKYVDDFGARTPDELKLENRRLTDDVPSILEMALKATEATLLAPRASANSWPKHVPVWRRPLLAWIAKNTRQSIDWRERFRFNRAQIFDTSRKAFLAIGKALAAERLIATERDVFWLTENEIDELVNGHAPILNAKELVAARKKQFSGYSKQPMPLGVHGAGRIAPAHLIKLDSANGGLQGNGVAPGQLTAEVLVATEFDPKLDVRGKILVVHHVDPGWTLLFTQAAGIVAERGNALSHAAIIAREIGIPAIVAVPGITQTLNTGQTISINGITGGISIEKN